MKNRIIFLRSFDREQIKSALVLIASVAAFVSTVGSQMVFAGIKAPESSLPSLADMLERANPSVVNIATRTTVVEQNRLLADPFFRQFFDLPESGRRYQRTQSAGSGVIVDSGKGLIVTNNHVIDRADEIMVGLSDGRTLIARLIGKDPQVDLALLEVEADELQHLEFAEISKVRVGDYVVAIGNPFGLSQTVTSGIVSALGRSGLGIEGYEDFIQTDAPINPGNSGGALVDLSGRLIGINTAIYAPSGGNVGIGFAIPANMVEAIVDQLLSVGEVNRGYLGIVVQAVNADLAEAFNIESDQGLPRGVIVVDVEPGSSGELAGFEPGDIILGINGKSIRRPADFESQTAITFLGDSVSVEIIRQQTEKSLMLEVISHTQESVPGLKLSGVFRGVLLKNFDSDDDGVSEGVLIEDIEDGSTVSSQGLEKGDVIVAANRRPISDLASLRSTLQSLSGQILLRVYRNGRFGSLLIR